MGAIASHFCQDGTRDFYKIDENIGRGRGSSKSSEKWRAWPKSFHLCPHFTALATPLSPIATVHA